jgi:hypothetical protein
MTDWSDKLIALSQTAKAPDDLDVPTAFKLVHPNAEELVKQYWVLGYLAGLGDATNVIEEEATNIAIEAIREWVEK